MPTRPLLALLPLLTGGVALVVGAWVGKVHPPGWPLLLWAAAVGAGPGALLGAFGWPRGARRMSVALAGVALLGGAWAWLGFAPGAPGVLVVVIDCLSADRLALMPHTRALAAQGWTFLDAQAQSSWTRSSVPSLLSGTWPAQHRLYRLEPQPDVLAPSTPLLAELLQQQGWSTALFAEQAQLDPAFGLGRGFDRYGHRDGAAPRLLDRYERWRRFYRHVPHLAWLHLLDVHKPFDPEPRFLPEGAAPPPGFGPELDQSALMEEVNHEGRPLDAEEWAWLRTLHEAEVVELDEVLGGLWARLAADGTLDTDWLVLTADHGEAFGEHGWFTHGGTPWQDVVHIPLVLRPPGGLPQGRELPGVVRQIDVAPTILGRFGLPPHPWMAGRDLGPLLDGGALAEEPSVAEYAAEGRRELAVRDGRWTLVGGEGADGLYDLASDPGETRDLAAEAPEVAARLRAVRARYLGVGPLGKPPPLR